MKVIGVTGGVGAGKSTVLNYLEERYGALVIQADTVGHEIMEPGEKAWKQIVECFGKQFCQEDGKIDRKLLGNLVFADPAKREQLNRITHPEVKKEILRRLQEASEEGRSCAVVEAALFLEENYGAFCDETWYIYTNEEKRRERLKQSRGYTDEKISQIAASQRSHEEFLRGCDWMIDNNGSPEETRRQIDRRMNR